ncbi:hypothetical protein [Pseudomonas syringae group sp. J309-1]|uniref:hypothetical protein n=1 Tax=Pseudomonas syringae group sp. J309-1 TaxID=3079588 RepID=UPI002914A078|nr:hypothetical protein [Pseudomonas syringae group sp. J309-1]MDU8358420.1 hypothetical protein [Pseudomonas syringae group sp. J309-1]
MERILAITLAFSVLANIALAAEVVRPELKPVTNLHDSKGIHEDLIASQELIALGCMGKLNIAPTASGRYDSASLVKIQECADNEGTDLAAKILAEYKQGEIEKARIPTYMVHYAVIFAKENNPEAQKMATTDLIKAARGRVKSNTPSRLSKKENVHARQ